MLFIVESVANREFSYVLIGSKVYQLAKDISSDFNVTLEFLFDISTIEDSISGFEIEYS